jgi:hypothetical protein
LKDPNASSSRAPTDTTKTIPTKGPTMTSHNNLTAARIIDTLSANQTAPRDLSARPEPGVYALFLATRGALPAIAESGTGALYIGSSSNLAQREFDTHFATGETGFSTVRRSLGALLRGELNLKPGPRGTGTSKTNYTNYRFDQAGERRLSEWMRQHLRVAVHAVPNPSEVEAGLIALAHPPLNLTGWPNPERAEIKRARKQCADAARQRR